MRLSLRYRALNFPLACLALCAAASAAGPPEPASHWQGRDGAPHALAELRGHPAVINFWATWCGPCREEMPRLQKLSEAYAGQGVRFIAISLDDPQTQSKIDKLVQSRNFTIPVWTGADVQTLADLKLGQLVPATLILDEAGEPIGKIEGEAREKDVRSRLDWLLGGKQGRAPKLVQRNDW